MKKAKFASALLAAVASLALVVVGMPMAFATAASYDTAGATRFVFSDSGIDATDGNYTGYKVKGTALTINEAGTYTVSGSCADGSITVKKGTTGVTLVLDGLTLTSVARKPIRVSSCWIWLETSRSSTASIALYCASERREGLVLIAVEYCWLRESLS